MKAIKLFLCVLFIFPTAKGFCQVIEDANICTVNGSLASFNVDYPTASTYVWQVKSPDSVNWITITSSNSVNVYTNYNTPTLNIKKSSTLPVIGTLYRVIVNDGSNNFTSNEAKLIVNAIPISKITMGASETCIGGDKTLTYGTGSVGDILWQSSTTGNLNDFYDIDGETKETFTATDLQETTWFRVMNSNVCKSVYSTAVKVVVNSLPVAGNIDLEGEDIRVCTSSNSTSFTLYNFEGTIVWQKSLDLGGVPGTFSNIPNAISDIYTAKSLKVNTYFRALVSSGVCTSETTTPILITVNAIPISKTIMGASETCIGGDKTLTYGTGSVGNILWQSSTSGNLDDFYDIAGETELIYTATDLQETTWFRVMNSSGECGSVYSPAVQVVVNPLPVAGNIDGGDINVCSGSNTTTLTLSNYVGAIQWQKALDVAGSPGTPGTFANITSAILPDYSATNLTATTYFRAVLSSGVCTSVTTDPVAIIVDPKPVSKLITGASAVCEGVNKTLTYGIGSVGDILWQYSTTSSLSDFYDLDGETEPTYTATGLQETTWFRVMNTSGECGSVYSPAVQVVVNPLPVAGNIDGGDINVCKSSNSTVLTLYNSEGTIQWQKAAEIAGPFENITSANKVIYTASAANSLRTTYYRALVSSGVCISVTTDSVAITFDPTPVSKLIIGASAVCEGSDKTLTYGTGSVGDIKWQYSTTSSSSDFYDLDEETEPTYTATGLQYTTWFRVMNTSGECGSVFSPAVQVVVNPLPVARNIDGGDINVCSVSNTTTLTLSNNYVGAIQWWQASEVAGSPGTPGTFAKIIGAITQNYSATNLIATTYFRVVLSSGVCTSVTTDPVAIIVDPKPVSKLISGASPACIGWSKVLVYGVGSVGEIQWQSSFTSNPEDFNDIPNENKLTYLSADLKETTWYRVKNTSGKCGSVFSPEVQIVVDKSIAGKIEGGNSIVLKKSNETELTLKDYTGSIQWQKAASLTGMFTNISLSTSPTYIVTGLTETTYFRALVSNGECSAVASDPVVVNMDSEFKALVFPNPFDSEFNINLTPQSTDPIELKIYDMLGRLIENHQVKPSEINSIRMGTTYPSGFFTVLIKQGQQEVNLKVLKK